MKTIYNSLKIIKPSRSKLINEIKDKKIRNYYKTAMLQCLDIKRRQLKSKSASYNPNLLDCKTYQFKEAPAIKYPATQVTHLRSNSQNYKIDTSSIIKSMLKTNVQPRAKLNLDQMKVVPFKANLIPNPKPTYCPGSEFQSCWMDSLKTIKRNRKLRKLGANMHEANLNSKEQLLRALQTNVGKLYKRSQAIQLKFVDERERARRELLKPDILFDGTYIYNHSYARF